MTSRPHGGGYDFLVHLAVRDAEHLRDFVINRISARDEVEHVETALIFEHQQTGRLPQYLDLD